MYIITVTLYFTNLSYFAPIILGWNKFTDYRSKFLTATYIIYGFFHFLTNKYNTLNLREAVILDAWFSSPSFWMLSADTLPDLSHSEVKSLHFPIFQTWRNTNNSSKYPEQYHPQQALQM